MPITFRLEKSDDAALSDQLPAIGQGGVSGGETMILHLTHFSAAVIFALVASIVFGITQRESARDMMRYGAYCFAMFVGGVMVAGWAMWLLRR
jgi:hypothetical protein